MANRITPYKGREIDYTLPVYIYRNLNCKGLSYSIRQKGLVVAHADALTLGNAKFLVSQKGRDRVIKEKRKNVHAFIKATISKEGVMGTDAIHEERNTQRLPLPVRVFYNPYTHNGFYHEWCGVKHTLKSAQGVIINKKGVFAAYTS